MTIAELFVKLGFVTDTNDLEKVDKQLKAGEASARKLAVGIGVVDAAMIALMKGMLGVAVGFQKFRLETGLSTDQLQRWQYAAHLANVSGAEVEGALKSIQDAQAAIKLGEGNIAPWQLLGIDPRQDPFKVLEEVHQRIQNLDPAVARHVTAQMGISDDMFQFLRRRDLGLDQFREQLVLTQRQEEEMLKLNKQWQQFTWQMERGAMSLAHTLAPAFERLLPVVEKVLENGSRFAEWATGSSEGAQRFRWALTYVAEAALFLGPALGVIAASAAAINTALAAGDLIGVLGGLSAAFIAWGSAITVTALAIAALATDMKLLKDTLDADEISKGAEANAERIEKKLGKTMRDKGYQPKTEREREIFEGTYHPDKGEIAAVGGPGARSIMDRSAVAFAVGAAQAAPLAAGAERSVLPREVSARPATSPRQAEPRSAAGQSGPVQVTHNVTVNVDGAKDPAATAREVVELINKQKRQEYAAVSDQIALPAQGF